MRRKTQYCVTTGFQHVLPFAVAFHLCRMYCPVYLDDQLIFEAAEVGHERTYGPLPPELQSTDLPVA